MPLAQTWLLRHEQIDPRLEKIPSTYNILGVSHLPIPSRSRDGGQASQRRVGSPLQTGTHRQRSCTTILFPVSQKWFATGEASAHLKYLEEKSLVFKEWVEGNIIYSLH